MLLGNKADLEDRRKVDTSEGAQVNIQSLWLTTSDNIFLSVKFAEKHDVQFFETSSLTTTNVTEVSNNRDSKVINWDLVHCKSTSMWENIL